jgi:CheY-like chemotaxis protein
MMVPSARQHDDVARCRALNAESYLVKPVRLSELRDSLLQALDMSTPQKASGQSRTPLRLRGGEALRILLAEDNAVNQMVMLRLLNKRGHHVTVANTGKAALEALQRARFDLVLMDVQMPELDGFQATAEIRRLEAGTADHVPIVALTAHAMSGDRERCIAAGMDGYMTKPINPEELDATLRRYGASMPAVATA